MSSIHCIAVERLPALVGRDESRPLGDKLMGYHPPVLEFPRHGKFAFPSARF
jgi:hypothetical protein